MVKLRQRKTPRLRNALCAFSALYVILWTSMRGSIKSSLAMNSVTGETSVFETEPVPSLPPPTKRTISESFVISFDSEKVDQFIERNHRANASDEFLWVPAVDGFHQPTLNMWAKLTKQYPAINATLFDRKKQQDKDAFHSPHAVGCYLAHWHLIRTLSYRPRELRPDVFFVFEDDASCVPDLVTQALEAVKQLPSDWDILYLGGKPFSDFNLTGQPFLNSSKTSLIKDLCRGVFGKGSSPLAPDGSRELSQDQPYWRTTHMLNTHAYVVNPQRVNRLLSILEPRQHIPIDILLAEAMGHNLNAFMTTQALCAGDIAPQKLDAPLPWEGFFRFPKQNFKRLQWHPALRKKRKPYLWHRMQLDNCSY